MKIAVIGSGISGAVCAAALAGRGVNVTVFEAGRGPGGRMSQRREMTEDGRELLFDHGAPYFIVNDNEVMGTVGAWESRGLVAEWKENFGIFDRGICKFVDPGEMLQEGFSKKFVGVPGMNSICRALCHEPGVEAKYGVTVGKLQWLDDSKLWCLTGMDGQSLGNFDGVVASDQNIASTCFTGLTGRSPPLAHGSGFSLAQTSALVSRWILSCVFDWLVNQIPNKGFSIKNSDVLSWAFCDSCKPGRPHESDRSECWVLHSTAEYAERIIRQTGLQKPTLKTLTRVAEDLFEEFRSIGVHVPQPSFMKAYRWGSAFPAIDVAGQDKCLWETSKKLAVCGDFRSSPSVEGAILSGGRAANKLLEIVCSL